MIRQAKGNVQRWIPIGKNLLQVLRKYLQEVRPQLTKNKTHNVLIVGEKGKPIYPSSMGKIVCSYCKKLGIKSTCHGLRHTFATHLLEGKANLRVIQSILGHKSLDTTQLYTQIDICDLALAIEKSHPREKMQCEEL